MSDRSEHLIVALIVAMGLVALANTASAQVKPQQAPPDDVVRVNTDLVQIDAAVFDKKGHFVDGLTADQFDLLVNNKPRAIEFLERVTPAASTTRPAETAGADSNRSSSRSARGRTILFFVDDLHLAPDSLARTRKSLLDFISRGVVQNDLVAITSASGQIGFLQQFTDNREVLQSAVARLNYRAQSKTDMENPPMSEYMAIRIREGDNSVINYYVEELMKQNCVKAGNEVVCMMTTQAARNLVIQRAREFTTERAPDTENALIMLQGLMRTAAQLPGRKLLFLISDGFYLNDTETGSRERIKNISEAAGRAGVVIYTLDARGLVNDGVDATNNRIVDPEGSLSTAGDTAASQEGLNALARDTGGRPFRNTNRPMAEWVKEVLDETSSYYLMAWRPDSDEQKKRKFDNLRISVKGRPDLTVRLRHAYFQTAPLPMLSLKSKHEKDPDKVRDDDMRTLIDAPVAQRDVPTDLAVDSYQIPGIGTRVVAAIKMNREALAYDVYEGGSAADVDVGGIFYDDKGKPKSSFVGRLRVFNDSRADRAPAVYRFQSWLAPGLYQLRVGVRDVRTGKSGSATEWIRVLAVN